MLVICPDCLKSMVCPIHDMGITVVSRPRDAIYRCDRYTCEHCGKQIITDCGAAMTQRLDNFEAILANADTHPDTIHLS